MCSAPASSSSSPASTPSPSSRPSTTESEARRTVWPSSMLSLGSPAPQLPVFSLCLATGLSLYVFSASKDYQHIDFQPSNQVLFGAGWFVVHSLLFPTLLPLPLPPVHLLRPPRSRGCHPLDCSGARDPIPKLRDVSSSYQTQGHMLAASSSCDTVSRNCGIFWSIFQESSLTRVTSEKLHLTMM